jgi:flagella basal body P-ring formation protein FlgA
VQATVRVIGEYVAAQSALAQGQTIGPADVTVVTGDLTSLPAGVVMTTSQAIGRKAAVSVPSGSALRSDALRASPVVQQGQTVQLVTSGPGFQVSAEGKAVTTGVDGQVVQARTASGQLISGVAKPGGIIEVAH